MDIWESIQRSKLDFRWMLAGKRWEHGTVHEAHGHGEIGRSWGLIDFVLAMSCDMFACCDPWVLAVLGSYSTYKLYHTWIYKKWMWMNLKMNGMYIHCLDCLKLQIVVDQGFFDRRCCCKKQCFLAAILWSWISKALLSERRGGGGSSTTPGICALPLRGGTWKAVAGAPSNPRWSGGVSGLVSHIFGWIPRTSFGQDNFTGYSTLTYIYIYTYINVSARLGGNELLILIAQGAVPL